KLLGVRRNVRVRFASKGQHDADMETTMERRSFLLALAGIGVVGTRAEARISPVADFRTRDLMGGEFAMETSRLALSKTGNPDIINFANAEIAEQVQVANALAAVPGTAPMRSDH